MEGVEDGGPERVPRRPRAGAPRRVSRGAAPVRRVRKRMPSRIDFRLGGVLARAFEIYGRHFVQLILVGAVIFLPQFLWSLHAAGKVWNPSYAEDWDGFFAPVRSFWARVEAEEGLLGRGLQYFLPNFLQAAVCFAVFSYLRGKGAPYGRSLQVTFQRFFYVLGAALCVVMVLLVVVFVAGLLLFGVFMSTGPQSAGAVILLSLVILVLVMWLQCILFLSVQSAMVEQVGPFRALARSAALTAGIRWKIFVILLVVGIISGAVGYIMQNIMFPDPGSMSAVRTAILVTALVTVVLAMFQAVCAAVVYHDVRREKEGVEIDDLIQVFD